MPALYLHIPFCQRKCPYCDFNTYAGQEHLFEPLAEALRQEIEAAGAARGHPPVETIFIGGGTPTVLPPNLLAGLLETCQRTFAVQSNAEISSEANPGTVDAARFAELRRLGVNRLSMGVQSFDDDELRFLGRIHNAAEARAAFQAARRAGFDNINLDFIFGLPDQSPQTWRRTLQQAIDLGPEHLSLYSLTIEENTPFGDLAAAGRLPIPDSDLAADLYELADELLASAGYVQYEISNWAKKNSEFRIQNSESGINNSPFSIHHSPFLCRHNLTYWRNEDFLGFGPGAHSAGEGQRWANLPGVKEYIANIENPREWTEEIDERLSMGETMMLGLRLVREGVAFERFAQHHARSLLDIFAAEVAELTQLGLLEVLPDRLRLTRSARLLGNQVFARFLPG